MNKYRCFYGGKTVDVEAESTYEAQCVALVSFQRGARKRVRSFEISVVLMEKSGAAITHDPAILGG